MKQLICSGLLAAGVLALIGTAAPPARASDGPYTYGSHRYDSVPDWYRNGYRSGFSWSLQPSVRYYSHATGLPFWYGSPGFGTYYDDYVVKRGGGASAPVQNYRIKRVDLRASDYGPQKVEVKVEPGIGYTISTTPHRAE